MPIISKEAAQRHLDMWMEAEAAVSTGQSYQIEQMMLTRASLKQIPGEHYLLGKESSRSGSRRKRPGQKPNLPLLAA